MPTRPNGPTRIIPRPYPRLPRLAAHAAGDPLRDPLIFLLEDDAHLGPIYRHVLEEAGAEVVLFGAASECIMASLRRPGPDLLITDLHVPGVNGAHVAQVLQSRRASLPVLFISGRDRQYAESMGVPARSAFLEKPFEPRALIAAVAPLLLPPPPLD